MENNLLKVEQLSIAYDQQMVVKKCNLELNEGEILVVLGASGDGKTSLLKGIAGLLPYAGGTVKLNGSPIKNAAEKLVPGHEEIQLINQDFNLDNFHSVEENIRLKLLAYDKDYQSERIKSLLRLTGLTKFREQKAQDLSGGQKQRLTIARALANEPQLILLDEPFTQLDFQTKNRIAKHIRSFLKRNKISAILVTHNGVEAMEWADKIAFMKKGKIVRIDTPQNFFDHPHSKNEARFFGELNKVKLKDQVYWFRPNHFREKKEQDFNLKLSLSFVNKQNLGMFTAYEFKTSDQKIRLYSTFDISTLSEIFVRKFQFND